MVDNRYLIDFWHRDVYRGKEPYLLDLQNPKHIPIIKRLYGNQSAWVSTVKDFNPSDFPPPKPEDD
jgi:hypothetical protein